VAAGSRDRLDSSPVAASSDPSSLSSSSGTRPTAPSSKSSNLTVSAEGRPYLLSAPKATPLPAPTGSVHGRNGWWRPPPSAARPTTAKLGPADTGRPTKKRKAVSVPREERALTAEAGERVIDLTAARLAPSQSGARQDLLRRLERHRSHNQDLPGKSEVSVEGVSPGSASPPLTSTDPSALEIQHMPSPAAHTVDRQAGTPSVDPANSSSSGVAAPSQPQPMRRMAEASLDEAILVDSSSSSPSPEAKPPHRTMNSQLAHRPSSPRVPEKTTSAAAAAKRKASSPEAPGRITFSRIPRDAGPTADYPILRGLDLQRRNAARQPAPPVARKTKGSEQARALEAAARPAGRLVDRGLKGSAGRSSPVEERPALPPPALQYHLPPSAVAGSPFAEGAGASFQTFLLVQQACQSLNSPLRDRPVQTGSVRRFRVLHSPPPRPSGQQPFPRSPLSTGRQPTTTHPSARPCPRSPNAGRRSLRLPADARRLCRARRQRWRARGSCCVGLFACRRRPLRLGPSGERRRRRRRRRTSDRRRPPST